jgi:protein involved in polysaccharide export with SLBB domain
LNQFYKNVQINTLLIDLRRFPVFVLGEVVNPGRYQAHAMTNVSSIVQIAGGVSSRGSSRNIKVIKGNGEETRADILQFMLVGDAGENPLLSEGDRIIVPVSSGIVSVSGAVGRPGDFEWVPGDRLLDYLELAGGFLDGALRNHVELYKFDPETGRNLDSLICNLEGMDLRGSPEDPPISMGDQIFVRRLPDWHERHIVEVRGEVYYPGSYAIQEGKESLSDLINRAGGFKPTASLHEAQLIRRYGLDQIDNEYERLKLIPRSEMTDDEYEYYKLRSREYKGRVVVNFEALYEENDKSEDLLLVRGDHIVVPRKKLMIMVSGQVANPGGVEFLPGKEVSYYIERAGGYGWRAREGSTRIIRARTGEWLNESDVDELDPGDTIWIPEKPERDWWQIFKDTMAVSAQIATVWLVVDRIAQD